METKNLKQKATAGLIWVALRNYASMGISFISGIILARLLTPHDYGCIGLLSIFMALSNTFIDAGFGSALIQKKDPTNTDYSTIFFWNMGVALFLYIILFFAAPPVARFYKIPLLSPVLRVQALVIILYAFNLVQINQLRKQLKFKILSLVTLCTSVIALAVTIVMAFHGLGVWSLVAQNLISAFLPAIFYWFYVKWRPIKTFSWSSFRQLFSFGSYVLLSHFVNEFCRHIPGLLIGKLFNAATLGYYSKAAGTEKMASQTISGVISNIVFPLYSAAQDDKKILGNIIKRLTMSIAYITFPLMLILMLIAKPLFVLLYSERWLPSVIYFQVLCTIGIASCLQTINAQSIAAIGKSKQMFNWTLMKRGVGSSAIIIGLLTYGMKGFLVGVIIFNYFSYAVNIWLVSKYIGYKWTSQLKDLLHITIMSVAAFVVSLASTYFLHTDIYVTGIIRLVVYLIVYIGWSLILKPEAFVYTINNIPTRFRFWEKRGKGKHS